MCSTDCLASRACRMRKKRKQLATVAGSPRSRLVFSAVRRPPSRRSRFSLTTKSSKKTDRCRDSQRCPSSSTVRGQASFLDFGKHGWVHGWSWSWLAGNGTGRLEGQPARLKPKLRSSQMVPPKFKWVGWGTWRDWRGTARLVEHDSGEHLASALGHLPG